jgi:hypothetical protein
LLFLPIGFASSSCFGFRFDSMRLTWPNYFNCFSCIWCWGGGGFCSNSSLFLYSLSGLICFFIGHHYVMC